MMPPSPLVAQLIENVDTLTKKVSELSQSVTSINAASTRSQRGSEGLACLGWEAARALLSMW